MFASLSDRTIELESPTESRASDGRQSSGIDHSPISFEHEKELVQEIKSLQEESLVVFDLLRLEKEYTREILGDLRRFLGQVGTSYDLDPKIFPKLGRSVSKVSLSPQGIFFLTYRDGMILSRPVEDLSTESLLNVLNSIVPGAKLVLEERRRFFSEKALSLQKIAEEIRKVPILSGLRRRLASMDAS